MGRVSEKQAKAEHRSKPTSENFKAFIASGWAPRDTTLPELSEAAQAAVARRDAVSAAFPGERLVIPAGGFKVRSNDCDYQFRPHSAFANLTGLGSDREPDAVLVLDGPAGVLAQVRMDRLTSPLPVAGASHVRVDGAGSARLCFHLHL